VKAALRVTLAAATIVLPTTGCGDIRGERPQTNRVADAAPCTDADPAPAGWTTYEDPSWGYTVANPDQWHRATQIREPSMGDPTVILALATFPLRADDAAYPWPRHGFDSDEAFVTLQERGLDPRSEWPGFPSRPAHFHFEPNQGWAPASYIRRASHLRFADHWFRFTDCGRHFHVLVVIGESAPAAAGRDVYRILDSLRFDPGVKPDWPASP
jgi:hypothetical protein